MDWIEENSKWYTPRRVWGTGSVLVAKGEAAAMHGPPTTAEPSVDPPGRLLLGLCNH